MRLLGPVLGRLQAELLQPLISRCFSILSRQKKFAPPPESLQGGDIDIEYVSPLAKAQRSGDVQAVMQMFEFLAPLMELDQTVVDYLDMDGLARHVIKVTGTPAVVTRGEAEVAELRQQRQQQQAQQQEMMMVQQAAQAAGQAAPALKEVREGGGLEALTA